MTETGHTPRGRSAIISSPDHQKTLTALIASIRLFADIPSTLLEDIVSTAFVQTGSADETLTIKADCYLGLVEGEICLLGDTPGRPLAAMRKCRNGNGADTDITLVYAPRGSLLRFDRHSKVILIDGNRLDEAVSRTALLDDLSDQPPAIRERLQWLTGIPVFSSLSPDQLVACAKALQASEHVSGEDIFRQGETGEYFYIVETGQLEVWRSDPLEETPAVCTATLAGGDVFGDEALLQNGLRSTTVRAMENCRLLRLGRRDFDRFLRNSLLREVDAAKARQMLAQGAVLLDCRYEMEYEISRIPNATLVPLDKLGGRITDLDPAQRYVIYCRSGRRSKAAAFLLARHGLDAVSVRGGINAWPWETECGPGEERPAEPVRILKAG